LKKSVFYGIRKVTVAKQQNYMYKVNHIRQGKLFHVFRSSKHSHTTGKQINQSCEALQMYALTNTVKVVTSNYHHFSLVSLTNFSQGIQWRPQTFSAQCPPYHQTLAMLPLARTPYEPDVLRVTKPMALKQ